MSKRSEIAHLIADVREQLAYLNELGAECLDAELPAFQDTGDAGVQILNATALEGRVKKAEVPQKTAPPADVRAPAAAVTKKPGSRIAALPSLAKRERVKPEISKPQGSTEMRDTNIEHAPIAPRSPVGAGQSATAEAVNETIEMIRADIGNCTRCPLYTGRTQVVHSTGNFQAELMFVGEAPGADEDAKGEPFVGRAGQLLTKIIESIGLSREEVFIGNINRCRPPGNRQPLPEEAAVCKPFLLREINVVKPRVIVVLGAHAAHNLLEVKTPISKLRGHFHDYFGVKVMPTFHPAYLLRDPHKKREVWEDMKKVREFLSAKV
jgi:uracil-DNA glycosylase